MNSKVIASALVILVAGIAAWQGGMFSTFAGDSPRFSECSYNSNTGNIQGSCGQEYGEIDGFYDITTSYSNGEARSNYFSTKITDIEVSGESKSPVFWWLYKNGYTNDKTQEEINEGDFPDDVNLNHGDLEWNNQIREGLEKGSVCKATIKVGVNNQFDLGTTEGEYEYANEPDSDEIDSDDMYPQERTFTSESITITQDYVSCQFDFTKIMNDGMSAPGKFVSWRGQEPDLADHGGRISFNIDYNIDSDGDGYNDDNDNCPEEPGISEKNGCPNSAPEIKNIDYPENISQGDKVEFKVEAIDEDSNDLTYSWSNGDIGSSTEYVFEENGTKTIEVTVQDGYGAKTSESLSFNVNQESGYNTTDIAVVGVLLLLATVAAVSRM